MQQNENMSDAIDQKADSDSYRLKMRYDNLLGVIVWIQAPGNVSPDAHAAAMEFYKTHNPQILDFLTEHASKTIQIGVVKLDLPTDEFESTALKAATEQSKRLSPCAVVMQFGNLRSDDGLIDRRYLLASFFQNKEDTVLFPQSRTQIILV